MKLHIARVFGRHLCVLVSMLAIGYATLSAAEPRSRLLESIDIHVPMAPSPVLVAGKRTLAYELHITNFSTNEIELQSLTVIDSDRATELTRYRGLDLFERMSRPGLNNETSQKQMLAGGSRAVVYLWIAIDEEAPSPAHLSHRLELNVLRPPGGEALTVQGGKLNIHNDSNLVLGPPLRGGPWVALYDPFMEHGHRTSIYTIDGRARIPARFAIDFIRLDKDASHSSGDETKVANWHGFGAEVLAVSDAVVTRAIDDMPTFDSIGESQGATPLENASGNYVTLDLGQGRYAFYEHLQHGSIRVKSGDRVNKGEVIARLGNSGSSSSGPHLHFHVADAPSTLSAEGLPYAFTTFEVVGAFEKIGDFATDKPWKTVTLSGGSKRSKELPSANAVLLFPER